MVGDLVARDPAEPRGEGDAVAVRPEGVEALPSGCEHLLYDIGLITRRNARAATPQMHQRRGLLHQPLPGRWLIGPGAADQAARRALTCPANRTSCLTVPDSHARLPRRSYQMVFHGLTYTLKSRVPCGTAGRGASPPLGGTQPLRPAVNVPELIIMSDEHCLESWMAFPMGDHVGFQAVPHPQEGKGDSPLFLSILCCVPLKVLHEGAVRQEFA